MASTASTGSSDSPLLMTEAKQQKARLMVWVSAILSEFWTEDAPDDMRAIQMRSWAAVLVEVTADELLAAWTRYQKEGPRSASGRLARPDAGALFQSVMKAHKHQREMNPPVRVQLAAPAPEPRMSPERMAEIMREAGYHSNVEAKPFPAVGEGDA